MSASTFNSALKAVARLLLPPIVVSATQCLLQRVGQESPELEYVPQGWSAHDPKIKGWNVQSIAETQKARWPAFVRNLEGTDPLGIAHEALAPTSTDYAAHNTLMCYAYVLTLAARKKDSLTVLDWGGGAGHYYLISQTLLPDAHIEYHCYDVPLLCRLGRELLPEVNFHENAEDVFHRQYDLVLSSGSLQYFENWSKIIHKLATASRDFLYITRLPILHRASSFVFVQRPHRHGYCTEYLGWYLNRGEFLRCVEETGLELVREFLINERPFVHRAPEQGECRGFLFRRLASQVD